MDRKELTEELGELRKKLNELHVENKSLKHRISDLRKKAQEKHDIDKLNYESEFAAHKMLHCYAGCWATIKGDMLEVQLTPSCNGEFQGQYEMIFSIGKKSWTVLGCRLPDNLCAKVEGISVHSMEELRMFIQGVRRDVQAYVERKIQVEFVEELLMKRKLFSRIWYTTSIQIVILTIPESNEDRQFSCNIQLKYDSDQCLPNTVTTEAEGLDGSKLQKLKRRMDILFKKHTLNEIFKHEYGSDSDLESMITVDSRLGEIDGP